MPSLTKLLLLYPVTNSLQNRLALSALSSNALQSILTSRPAVVADTQNFNTRISTEGSPVTNQRSSGRCWLFASTNVFRVAFMKKYNLKSFELSQAYLFFWDKLEKANYFLETVIDTVDEPLDGRFMQSLMGGVFSDGGQFTMVSNLVEKYGLVPQSLYPDSYNAMNSSGMDRLITTKLREDCLKLRALANSASATSADLSIAKQKMIREVHLILTLMLGPPPSPSKEFTWEYYDSSEKFHSLTATPLEFSSQLSDVKSVRACGGTDVHKLFSLVNDPRNDYMQLLSVDSLGNVWHGKPVEYVNVDMDTMKRACISMIKVGLPVFFGSDVGKESDSGKGIMDRNLFDYDSAFNIRLGMTKAERLMVGESAMTHAVRPDRYRAAKYAY
jgi:bleomycin hydrolase